MAPRRPDFGALFGTPAPDDSRPPEKSWLTFLLSFGSLLVGALGVLTLPPWAVALAGLYLAVVMVAALYNPTVRLSRWLAGRVRRFRLAKATERLLVDILKELTSLMHRDRGDTVLSLLKEVAQWETSALASPSRPGDYRQP